MGVDKSKSISTHGDYFFLAHRGLIQCIHLCIGELPQPLTSFGCHPSHCSKEYGRGRMGTSHTWTPFQFILIFTFILFSWQTFVLRNFATSYCLKMKPDQVKTVAPIPWPGCATPQSVRVCSKYRPLVTCNGPPSQATK